MTDLKTTAADTLRTRAAKSLDAMRAADAWEALATHAATQASDCRRGAALADRTRHRWAR